MKTILIIAAMMNFNVAWSQPKKINTSSKTAPSVNIQSKKAPFEVKSKQQIVNEIQQGEKDLHFLGDYQLFAGVQEINIGHFTLNDDGTYRVVVNSDTSVYSIGKYEFDPMNKSLKWVSGLFYTNNYDGIINNTHAQYLKIYFNSYTLGQKILNLK